MGLASALLCFFLTKQNLYYAFGVDQTKETRVFSFGTTYPQTWLIQQRIDTGGWISNQSSSFYGTYQIGTISSNSVLYAEVFSGPSLISNTDNRLSTVLQFKHDIGIGVLGKDKVGIGINYSHLSNAGIKLPNAGRDFILIKLTIPILD